MRTVTQRVDALLARDLPWPCPPAAVRMVALEEDCRLTAYQDRTGRWTCGWGETDGVQPGTVWTQAQADQRLLQSLTVWSDGIRAALGGTYASANQFSAFLSFAYNIGLAGFRASSVLRLHQAGDYAGSARAFALWNQSRVRGVRQDDPVLVGRRAREAALYLTPDDVDGWREPVPQAVAAESSLARSPIAASGAVVAGSGAVSLVAQVSEQAGAIGSVLHDVRTTVVDTLGVPPSAFLPLVLVAAGGASIYWRWRQRKGGWA